MKNTLMITFKDMTQQLIKFGLTVRLQDIADRIEERKTIEKEFSLDDIALENELISQNEVVQ